MNRGRVTASFFVSRSKSEGDKDPAGRKPKTVVACKGLMSTVGPLTASPFHMVLYLITRWYQRMKPGGEAGERFSNLDI